MRYTTETFIKKSNDIHNYKYDYTKTIFTNIKNKVIIICKLHGEFTQTADGHIRGRNCPNCNKSIKLTKNIFITKSQQTHGDLYDYNNVNYINSIIKVEILCPTHGAFNMRPSYHIQGYGCPKCSKNVFAYTQETFIEKATKIHNNTYDYSKVIYTKINDKIIIICKKHGDFNQTASNHINQKNGCPKCKNTRNSNTDEFLIKAKLVWKDLYDLSKINYVNSRSNIIVICKIHDEFNITGNNFLSGSGCIKCGNMSSSNKQRRTEEEYIKIANTFHNHLYLYDNLNYTNTDSYINIKCKQHGEFQRIAKYHLKGAGCPQCDINNKFSKISINWLSFMEIYYNISIQHMGNCNNEYKIKDTRWKADGYCKNTNTIYEFHGSFFHGDPTLFSSDYYNVVSKRTMGTLYQNTINRENKIKQLGYNLIVMWESKWNKINKAIKILQKNFIKRKKLPIN